MQSQKTIRAGLVGVTGYTGMELVRLMANHPHMQLTHITSRQEAGKKLVDIYPFVQGLPVSELIISQPDPKTLASECDVVFLAIPHGAAMNMGAELVHLQCKVIDLSADFRLHDATIYEKWYKVPHSQKQVLKQAVYGLPELYEDAIAKATLVANPGCYPTAALLGLYPSLHHNIIDANDIIIDAKSGTTGAGRGANMGTLFCEVTDNFKAYSLTTHRHTPEIEQEITLLSGQAVTVSFNPHLLPVNRGILETIYTKPTNTPLSLQKIHALYTKTYKPHIFVRVLPLGTLPELKFVRGTMFCDIGLAIDERTNRLIIVVAIDNLCRGASGQALANANLMCGLPLETGLFYPPLVP